MSEIAVITPFYLPIQDNAPWYGWLNEAIESVFRQTFKDWELILVSDASPVSLNGSLPPNVKLLKSDVRRGPGAARNAGVRASTAPWIIGLDADDRLKPEALEVLYANRGERLITYGDVEWFGDGPKSGVEPLQDWSVDALHKLNGPIGVTALYNRVMWEKSGGWLEHLDGLEDIEYWMRLTEQGAWGKHLPIVTFEYRQHETSRTRTFKDNGKEAALIAEIRQRHANILNLERGQTKMAQIVQVKYVGARMGGFTMPVSPSGQTYRCGGHGDYLHVAVADLDWLKSFRGPLGPEWMVIEAEPAPVPFQVLTAPVVIPEATNLQSHLPDITEMNVGAAQAAVADISDVVDLSTLLAMEEASPTPRKTVLKAIAARIEAITGDQGEEEEPQA